MRQRIVVLLLVAGVTAGCGRASTSSSDSAFAGVQQRGGMAMGVDQYTSQHKFESTAEGGRISLQRDSDDSLGVAQIRAHMRLIQHAFEAGDFSTPAFVHQREMPGTSVLTRKRGLISYRYEDLPRGGAVVISSSDPEARKAIADFLEAQRADHRSH